MPVGKSQLHRTVTFAYQEKDTTTKKVSSPYCAPYIENVYYLIGINFSENLVLQYKPL